MLERRLGQYQGVEEAYERNDSRLEIFRKNRDGGARKGGSCYCKSQRKGRENARKGREEAWGF